MEPNLLLAALAQPAAYPYPVAAVEVRHTHISVVFLAGPYVYKVKKPVDLGFLDFSTLAKRRHYGEEEVRLNRRLAPSVYLGVVPVARAGDNFRVEGQGKVAEWAVKMERLPDTATLRDRLIHGEVESDLVEALARKLAAFHDRAENGPRVAEFGRWPVVARNIRENFEQSETQIGVTVSRLVFDRLRTLAERALTDLRPLIEARADRGVPRDTHGDLHLDHVYVFPEKRPPDDLVIIDCIEFNERFRFADPVADMAFLAMDFAFHGRRDLACAFADAYFQESADEEGRELLSFYTSYRAAVRGKVEGFELFEKEVPGAERDAAQVRSRAHWLLALGELEAPGRRPSLVLVGGLPGAGKSTLAHALSQRANFEVIRSDVVRKELAGERRGVSPPVQHEGIYSPAWTEQTYAACLRRAGELLFEGKRVVVDATFQDDRHRQLILRAALAWGVPTTFLHCHAGREIVRERLAGRRGDVSDADWEIYQLAAGRWQEPGDFTRPFWNDISTDGAPEESLACAVHVLRGLDLVEK